ncbi:universal stress protein [Agriterribacter sp.]|uniref:universal stress protein n=1 Tax=Agriterribacter sp. TaxID=2821509 RepID=UPI002BA0B449|nr:universal stress protein [Agriterribacter sp.]HTN07812.1 universal stress protein [Agriterribacter sp.]
MKKIIAPVDFSEPSVNAAKYAVQLASDLPDSTVTLYYVYETIIAGSDGTPLLIDPDARKNVAIMALNNLKKELEGLAKIPVDVVAEEGRLAPCLEKYVKQNAADLIVMGITGSSKIEQLIIGSNTLNVISKDICPVFIIPGNASYKKIDRAIFTSDLKNVESTTPLRPLKKILDMLHPELYVVHVTATHTAVPEAEMTEKRKLEPLLKDYNPHYFFVLEENFTAAVDKFAEEYSADIIITVPRKHSFLASLFKGSNTKKLAYHSSLPILALHSWE